MSDIWSDITRRLDLLEVALKEVGERGRAYAESEAAYRQALAVKILELRDAHTPVTICPDLARGDAKVSRLKLERDCAEASYKAALEAINCYKLRIKVLEAEYDRELRG